MVGILAGIRDITRFDDVKEIQKLIRLGLVACKLGQSQRRDQNQAQRTQKADIRAVLGGQNLQCSMQKSSKGCINTIWQGREFAEERAVAVRDSL